MRKWHRWISVFFSIFLVWIAVTGVASQIVPLLGAQNAGKTAAQGGPPAQFVCPPEYLCRLKPQPGDPRSVVGLLHHLHSGESFGPVGVAISALSGVALLFFSISGLWMYIVMWRNRRNRQLKPGWFWK